MKNTINLDGFIQIALVVEDIEKAGKAWAKLFGVPEPEVHDASMVEIRTSHTEGKLLYTEQKWQSFALAAL